MDLQSKFVAFAGLGAEWVMWLLIGLSVIAVAIILERAFVFLGSRADGRALQKALRKHLEAGDFKKARTELESSKSFEAQIVRAGLEVADAGPEAVDERLQGATKLARANMERNLAFLGTVGNNAPFVGLFGTVIGIINSFRELSDSQGQVSETLMAEIGEALVATAIGILVALPAVAFFNIFQRVMRGRLTWADALGHDVLSTLRGAKEAE